MCLLKLYLIRAAAINECETGAADCATNATCIDTLGNFECRCDEGFEGDGATECIGELSPCHSSNLEMLLHDVAIYYVYTHTCTYLYYNNYSYI